MVAEAKPRPSLRETDPDAWIKAELERLFRQAIPPSERYAAASNRIRDYLEIRFGLPFLEWTSGEVREGFDQVPGLPERAAANLVSALGFCDLVVFARHAPSADEEAAFASGIVTALSSLPPRVREAAA